MSRYQYRISGELGWMSNSGNAILAITNPPGSGKKLTLRGFEINPLGSTTTGTAGTASAATATALTLARATVDGGIPVTPSRLDTDAAAWPSTVAVMRRATVTSPTALARAFVLKQLNQASLSWLGRQTPVGRLSGLWKTPRRDSSVEGIVVRAGESIALYCSALQNAIPVRVSATVHRLGSPNRSYAFRYYTAIVAADEAVLAIANAAGSGETVVLRNVSVEEVGTYDSPYFQLVPIGSLLEGEATESVQVLKMDTASPDPSAWIAARQDAPMLPLGMPENALADSSTGSPKGFNYLKTKDFLGPVYRTVFPEYAIRPGQTGDIVPSGQRWHDPFVRKSGIVIREGEGVALVSGAETAAGATAAVGVSGWNPFEFAAVVDVEPATIPVVALAGMVDGSRWRIERVSDSSLVADGVAGVAGTASFSYTTEDTPLSLRLKVRKASAAPYYKPYEATFTLTSAGISVPVSQVVDP